MRSRPPILEKTIRPAVLIAAWLFAAPFTHAGPKGEQVVNGSAAFNRAGDLTTIRASNGSIINYRSFDIGKGETVRFLQPGSNSTVLNRVLGADPTSIFGQIQANGIVYLVNPSGIYFRDGSMINVGRLYAAAGTIADADFLSGRNHFSNLTGSVTNAGQISTLQGANMLGANVANFGSIAADKGTVVLVSGSDVLLGKRGDNVFVKANPNAATAPTSTVPGVQNAGRITAPRAVMGAGDMYSVAISNTGLVRAREITMKGGATGIVHISGTLDASTRDPRGTGGTVQITGEKIAVRAASIDASGPRGGGAVRIGGDFHGGGRLRRAEQTIVDNATTIKADATVAGDGGSVVVWSDKFTQYHGDISARGGPEAGNGGNAEISSPEALVAKGGVDLRAPVGTTGTVLYDPENIVIRGGTGDGGDNPDASSGNLQNGSGTDVKGFIGFGDEAVGAPPVFEIFESEIESSDANIVLRATNGVTTMGAFNNTDANGFGLLTIFNGRTLTIETRNALGDGNAGINLATLHLQTSGGAITLRTGIAQLTPLIAPIVIGSITSGSAAITIDATGAVTQAANGLITGGSLDVTGRTIGAPAFPLNVNSAVLETATVANGNQFLSVPAAATTGITSAATGTGTISLTGTGTFALNADNVINNAASLVISGPTLALGTRSDTLAAVTLNSGSITGTTGSLSSNSAFELRSGSVSAILGGNVGISKTTPGIVVLSGANTFTGDVALSEGTLRLGAANVIPNGSEVALPGGVDTTLDLAGFNETIGQLSGGSLGGKVTLGGATLTVGNASDSNFFGAISGAGNLIKIGTGDLVLGGGNTFTGLTRIDAGTVRVQSSNNLAPASSLNVNGGSFDLQANNVTLNAVTLTSGSIIGTGTLTSVTAFQTLSGTIGANLGGAAGLVKSSAGIVLLNGANTYLGTTRIDAGTLRLGPNDALADGSSVNVNGGILDLQNVSENVGAVTLTNGAINGTGTLSSASDFQLLSGTVNASLGGGLGVNKTSIGTVTLNRANSYAGATTISGGTLAITVDGALGSVASGTTVNGGGVLDLQNGIDFSGELLTLNGGTLRASSGTNLTTSGVSLVENSTIDVIAGSLTIGGTISGDSLKGFNKTGAGALQLTGINTYTGTTTISAGVLRINGGSAIFDTSAVNVAASGAAFELLASETIGSLSGVAGSLVRLNANTLTAGDAANTTFAGVISGTGAFNKTGAGALTLSGANTFTGGTNILDGTLRLGGNNALASGGAVAINNPAGTGAALLDLGAFNVTLGSLTFFAPANNVTSAVNVGTGTLTLNGNIFVRDNTTNPGNGFSSRINSAGGALDLGGQVRTFDIQGQNLFSRNELIVGAALQNGGVRINAAPSTTIANTEAGVVFGAANSYALDTFIAQGRLTTAVNGALPAGTDLVLGTANSSIAGSVDLAGTTQTVSSLALAQGNSGGTGNFIASLNGSPATLTVSGPAATDTTFGGLLGSPLPGGPGGPITLIKSGASRLTLTASNTFPGETRVLGGTLALNAASANALPGNVLVDGGTLLLQAGQQINDVATVTVTSGTFSIGANNEALTGLILNGGTIVGTTGILSTNTTVDLRSGTLAADIGGFVNVSKTTAGMVTVTHANSYLGTTEINGGTLALTTNNTLGGGAAGTTVNVGGALDLQNLAFTTVEALTLNGGTLRTSIGTSAFNGGITLAENSFIDVTGAQLTLGGVLSDAGAGKGYTKTGSGLLLITAASGYSGGTQIFGGTLRAGLANALPAGSTLTVRGAGSVFDLNGFAQFVGGLDDGGIAGGVVSNAGAPTTFTIGNSVSNSFSGTITGALSLVKTNAGQLTLGGANTFTGSTTVRSGTLRLANGPNRLPIGTTLTLGDAVGNTSGVFDLNDQNQELAGLIAVGTGENNRVVNSGLVTPTLTLNVATGTANFTGILGRAGDDGFAITKIGAGTQIFSGVNTFTGVTNLNAGIIRVSSASALGAAGPASGTIVRDGATLQLDGLVTLAEPLSIAGSGAAGAVGAVQTLTGTGTLNGPILLNGNATIAANAGSRLVLANGGTINGAFDLTLVLPVGANMTLFGAIGGITPLTNLNSIGGGTLTLGDAISVAGGGVTFNSPIVLADPVVINSSGQIIFNATVNGDGSPGRTLNLNADTDGNGGGIVTFAQNVGDSGLPERIIFGPSVDRIDLNAPRFRTANGIFFSAPVSLGADAEVSAGNGVADFDSTIAGNDRTLRVLSDARFGDTVGVVSALRSLEVAGETEFDGATIVTTEGQIYTGAARLTGDSTLSTTGGAGSILFISTLAGPRSLTATTAGAGNVTFAGDVGTLQTLTVNANTLLAGNVKTTGAISFTARAGITTTGLVETTDASANAVRYTAGADAFFREINAVDGEVTITAAGAIKGFENDGTVRALRATLTAGTGVGDTATPIKSAVGTIIGAGGTGGFFLDNRPEPLIVGNVSADRTVSLQAGRLTLAGQIRSGVAVLLTSNSSIVQTGGAIVAPRLGVRSVDGVIFGVNNTVDQIAAIISGAGQSFTFASGSAITVGTAGTISGITTNNGAVNLEAQNGAITLNRNVQAGSGTVTLRAAAGRIATAGGVIGAGTLQTTSFGGTTLTGSNAVNRFKATNGGGGEILLENNTPLTLTGLVQIGGGDITIKNDSTISIANPVNAGSSGDIILNARGAIRQSSGATITGDSLAIDSVGGANLEGPNAINFLTAKNDGSGDLIFRNQRALTIESIEQNGGDVSVIADGKLTASGTIEGAGGIELEATPSGADLVINAALDGGDLVRLFAGSNVLVKAPAFGGAFDITGQVIQLSGDLEARSGDLKAQAGTGLFLEGLNYTADNIFLSIDPVGNPAPPEKATIVITNPALVTITAGGEFTVGLDQKILSFGSLTINAGNVTIGDVAVRDAFTVGADSVTLLDRNPNGTASGSSSDRGLNIVATTIDFGGASLGFAGTGNGMASFAVLDGKPAVERIAGVTFYQDPNLLSKFPAETGVPAGGFQPGFPATSLPNMPIAGGTVDSQVVAVLAGALPTLVAPDPNREDKISAATVAKLLSLGVNAREPDDEEKKGVLAKRALYKQLIARQGASDSEYKVVVNRIASSQVSKVLEKYDQIFGKEQEAKPVIEEMFRRLYGNYVEETGATDANGFGKYLESKRAEDPQAGEAVRVLAQFRDLFTEIGKLGLTPKEISISQEVLARALTVEGLTSADFLTLIGTPKNAKVPAGTAPDGSALPAAAPTPPLETPPLLRPEPLIQPSRPTAPEGLPPEYFRRELPPLPLVGTALP